MKVVVVGTGIGGVSAAYHLVKDGHEVVMLEKEKYVGGHTHALKIDEEQVDLGFMMYGDSNPNIKAWFKSLGITKEDGTSGIRIPMSMSVSSDIHGDVQFSSRRPFRGFTDLFDIQVWRIIGDIYRFTVDLLTMPVKENITVDEWSKSGKYSHEFFRHYFLPFVAILWTIPKSDVMTLPVTQFLRCLKTHSNSLYIPLWQVVMGALGRRMDRPKHLWWYIGSKYKDPFYEFFAQHNGVVRTNSKVKLVEQGGKAVVLSDGERIECDHVVIAAHADETAAMIPWSVQGVPELMKYKFHNSKMYVHRDPTFLPNDKKSWSSWNVRITDDDDYILTYWMNRIQRLKSKDDIFVTITPLDFKGKKPASETIISSFDWDHPRLLADCIPQNEILNEENIALAGAWLGRGFHEDGFVSGRLAAKIVNDEKNSGTALYEDEGNIPVPLVPPFGMPFFVQFFFTSVVAATAYGAFKLIA